MDTYIKGYPNHTQCLTIYERKGPPHVIKQSTKQRNNRQKLEESTRVSNTGCKFTSLGMTKSRSRIGISILYWSINESDINNNKHPHIMDFRTSNDITSWNEIKCDMNHFYKGRITFLCLLTETKTSLKERKLPNRMRYSDKTWMNEIEWINSSFKS